MKGDKSLHIPPQAHLLLRKLQLQLEEEKHISSTLGDLAGTLIALGRERSLDEIIVQLQHQSEHDPIARTAAQKR